MGGEQKSNKLLVILLIVTLVLVLALAGFFGYYMFFSKDSKSSNGGGNKATSTKAEEFTSELNKFVVNLADEDKRYIQTTIVLAYENEKLAEEITKKTPQVCDIINRTLRSKKAEDFDGEGLDKVKNEMVSKINEVLTAGKITNIYFQEIIIQ
jgi:flagellar FliL protein